MSNKVVRLVPKTKRVYTNLERDLLCCMARVLTKHYAKVELDFGKTDEGEEWCVVFDTKGHIKARFWLQDGVHYHEGYSLPNGKHHGLWSLMHQVLPKFVVNEMHSTEEQSHG